MSVYSGQMRLKRASQELARGWHATRSLWRDDVARQFETEHLELLLAKLRSAEAAMANMVRALNQIRRDCE